jgi:hypothetical protein
MAPLLRIEPERNRTPVALRAFGCDITGTHLHHLHDAIEHFQLKAVRELASPAMPGKFPDATVSLIEITEKTDD